MAPIDAGPVDISRPHRVTRRKPLQAGPVLTPRPIGPTPLWLQRFQTELGANAMGYAFAAAYHNPSTNQSTVYTMGQGLSRSWFESYSPGQPWKSATRCNLASVSKLVTAAATVLFFSDESGWLDQPFWPMISNQFTSNPDFHLGQGVANVTFRQLLTMTSGLAIKDDSVLNFPDHSIWVFLTDYLQQPVTGNNNPTYQNTNFTILQAVIDNNAPAHGYSDYVDYVKRALLQPMGIDTSFNGFSEAPSTEYAATLGYHGSVDRRKGKYIPQIDAVAAVGWIAPADQLIKFMTGLRHNTPLRQDLVALMLDNKLGCYSLPGAYGTYYHHNGQLHYYIDQTGVDVEIYTGVIRLGSEWDCVLLINSASAIDPINLMVEAFEAGIQGDLAPVYRYFNGETQAHFYTTNQEPPTTDSWSFSGIRFYAPATTQPGAPSVTEYRIPSTGDPSSFLYYYTPAVNAPGNEWKKVSPKFASMQPMGGSVPQTVAPLLEYIHNTIPNLYFYTSNPTLERIAQYTEVNNYNVGYVYDALASPVFRYYKKDEHGHYVFSYSFNPPSRYLPWNCQGLKFYALASQPPGLVQLYQYVYENNSNYHWFSLGDAPYPQDKWQLLPTGSIYVWPNPQDAVNTVPLESWTLDSCPDQIQLLTSDPHSEDLWGWTKQGTLGYVYNPQWTTSSPPAAIRSDHDVELVAHKNT
jgi:CubicO group peptidase (beta-lactamase class C family)